MPISKSNQFRKIKRITAPEIVLDQVKNLILNRNFLPGDKLPPEREMAELIGVSRPSLREALKTLAAYGTVDIKHGSGIYIKEPNLDIAIFPITVMLSREKNIIDELIEAREIVEVEIVRLAAERANDQVLTEIEELLNSREIPQKVEKLEGTFDFEFEKLIAKMVGNRVLMSIQEATHTLWGLGLRKIGIKPLPVDVINVEHRQVYEKIKTKDIEGAKKAMIYHLRAPLRGYSK
jgi:GntR family transcriptional regulator, transcriptional repressor for pyruvate dehydrogenase complex